MRATCLSWETSRTPFPTPTRDLPEREPGHRAPFLSSTDLLAHDFSLRNRSRIRVSPFKEKDPKARNSFSCVAGMCHCPCSWRKVEAQNPWRTMSDLWGGLRTPFRHGRPKTMSFRAKSRAAGRSEESLRGIPRSLRFAGALLAPRVVIPRSPRRLGICSFLRSFSISALRSGNSQTVESRKDGFAATPVQGRLPVDWQKAWG